MISNPVLYFKKKEDSLCKWLVDCQEPLKMLIILFFLLIMWREHKRNFFRLWVLIIWVWFISFSVGVSISLFLRFLIFLIYAGGVLLIYFFVLSIDNVTEAWSLPWWLLITLLPLTTNVAAGGGSIQMIERINSCYPLISLCLLVVLRMFLFHPAVSSRIRS